MSIERNYYRVYRKAVWDGNPASWVLDAHLWPVSAQQTAAPGLGTATIKRIYGRGKYENNSNLVNGSSLSSLAGSFVRITRCDTEGGANEQYLFVGVVPAEEFELKGQSAEGYRSADQMITAVELEYLLDVRIDSCIAVDSGVAKELQWTPPFNVRTRTGGIQGNKSGLRHTVNGITSYLFEQADWIEDTPFSVWSVYDVLEYLQHFCPSELGITLSIPDGHLYSLQSLKGVWNFSGKTVRQALNELINPGFGYSWKLAVDDNDSIVLKVWSLLDRQLTVGDIILPVHDPADITSLNLWSDAEKTHVSIAADSTPLAKRITARGGPVKVAGTFAVEDGTLEPDWTQQDEELYIEGVSKTLDNYDELEESEQARLNDQFRASDRMSKVFAAFRIPKTWDWTVRNIKSDVRLMNPLLDTATGQFDLNTPAPAWNAGKRLLPTLPFLEGFEYDKEQPVNHNPTCSEPDWRTCFAIIQRTDGRWEYCDKQKPYSATSQPMTDQPGMRVKYNPAHLLSLNWYDPIEDPPTQIYQRWDEREWSEIAADYRNLAVTAMIETDQTFAMTLEFDVPTGREIVIDVPDAELWLAVPGTVYDIGPGGTLKRFSCTDPAIRNDRDVLNAALAAAAAWYGRRQYKAVIRHAKVEPLLLIGTMIAGLDVEWTGMRGACVSSISYDFERGLTTIQTSFAELNIAALIGLGRNRQGGHYGRSDYAAVHRELQQIKRDMANPRRLGGYTAIGPGFIGSNRRGIIRSELDTEAMTFRFNLLDYNGVEQTEGDGANQTAYCPAAYLDYVIPMAECAIFKLEGKWWCTAIWTQRLSSLSSSSRAYSSSSSYQSSASSHVSSSSSERSSESSAKSSSDSSKSSLSQSSASSQSLSSALTVSSSSSAESSSSSKSIVSSSSSSKASISSSSSSQAGSSSSSKSASSSSSSSAASRSSLSSSVEEVGCTRCCNELASGNRQFWMKVEVWQFGYLVGHDEGILTHESRCRWGMAGHGYLIIDFCWQEEDGGIYTTSFSGTGAVVAGECSPLSGYIEHISGYGAKYRIWWHIL